MPERALIALSKRTLRLTAPLLDVPDEERCNVVAKIWACLDYRVYTRLEQYGASSSEDNRYQDRGAAVVSMNVDDRDDKRLLKPASEIPKFQGTAGPADQRLTVCRDRAIIDLTNFRKRKLAASVLTAAHEDTGDRVANRPTAIRGRSIINLCC